MATLFNTRLALIQAPMAGVQNADLAIAVCNAGGLGSLPCAMLSKELLLSELTKLTQATEQPYNLNFFCHTPVSYSVEQKEHWHALLAPYFVEFGIDESTLGMSASRQPIDADIVDLIAPFKPPVISFHFGLPEPSIVKKIKSWGGKVISTATTLTEATWLEEHGADAVIAQGLEAGGHRGHFLSMDLSLHLPTKQLVEQCVAELSIAVIAAGGIATAADVTSMQALGASAVQIGSAYLLCEEATTSVLHQQALLDQAAQSTSLTTLFSGRAARGINNRAMVELGAEPTQTPPFPYASIAMAALRAKTEALNSSGFSPLWCGQNFVSRVGLNADKITKQLMKGWQ